jgi:hypothetical protein
MMRRLNSVYARHADIKEYDVRPDACGDVQRFLAVGRFADNFVLAGIFEQLPQSIARRRLIVNDQNFHVVDSS